jgi:hypothetical protein
MVRPAIALLSLMSICGSALALKSDPIDQARGPPDIPSAAVINP